MNKDQFLNTGLLEQYALGLTSEEENQEVEKYLKAYPELKKEVEEIRKAIEHYAMQQAIPPHPRVKSKVMSEIASQKSVPSSFGSSVNRWLSVAALLSFAAVFGLLFLYTQKQTQHQQLKREFAELQLACDSKEERVLADLELFQFLKHHQTQKISLNSITANSVPEAVAFWNPMEGKAYANLGTLPAPPEGKQYQIWADIDHVMISVGLLKNNPADLQAIEFLADAESLNITIEPEGGSEKPNTEQLVVSGRI